MEGTDFGTPQWGTAPPKPPPEPPRPGQQPAGVVLGVGIVALVVAMFLNIDQLVRDAEQKPFGTARDVSLAVWEPVQDVAHVLQLHRPRQVADAALGRDHGDDVLDLPPVTTAAPVVAEVAPTTTTIPEPELRVPTPAEPLRMWVGGDSLANDFGPAVARLAAEEAVLETELDARISTGLTRPDYFDWPGHLLEIVETDDPELMIVIFGANDGQGIVTPEGDIFQTGEEGWAVEYRRRVAGTMDLLEDPARDRQVVWVGLPPMRDPDFDVRMQRQNEIYESEAASRPWIRFLSTTELFSDANGSYAALLPGEDGGLVDMRQGDGIHLSVAGANRLAGELMAVVAEEVDLTGGVPAPATTAGVADAPAAPAVGG